jgi:beta-lactamase regulating signal transducer with metallopeptidase domain
MNPSAAAPTHQPAAGQSPQVRGSVVHSSLTLADCLAIVWITGAISCALPLLIALLSINFRTRSWRNASDDPQWSAALNQAKQRSGVHRSVRLLIADEGQTPMTFGTINPTIVVPADASDWPPSRQQAMLLHELAHIRRFDCLTSSLARLARALHWPNPLAWQLVKHLDTEREYACDDAVVNSGTSQTQYARELVAVAAGRIPFTLGVAMPFARKSTLDQRVKEVLNQHRNRRGITWLQAALIVLAGSAVALPAVVLRAADEPAPQNADKSKPENDDQVQDKNGLTPQAKIIVNNMKQVGLMAIMFANDHKGVLPHDLGETLPYSNPGARASLFLTPADLATHQPPSPVTKDWISQNTSYIYLADDLPTGKIPPDARYAQTIMFHTSLDKPLHNPTAGDTVLATYIDGHLEILTLDEAKKEVEVSKKNIKEMKAGK